MTRAVDVLGLSLSALRQQKVRTVLTLLGVVVGTFTLVLSLSVGRGVDRAIVDLFHETDALRQIHVFLKYEATAEDLPADQRKPRGEMSDAKRARILQALLRNSWGVVGKPRNRLTVAALKRLEALDHVVRVEPLVDIDGTAALESKEQAVDATPVLSGTKFFRDRLLAGRLFTPEDGRVAIVHEYLLYRWGLASDQDAAATLGRTFRLEYRTAPPGKVSLSWVLNRGTETPSAGEARALDSALKRLAGIVRFLPLPREEQAVLRKLFERISSTSSTIPEQQYAERFTIVGVLRETSDEDAKPGPFFGSWRIQNADILLPTGAAAAFYLRAPEQAERGFDQVVITVDQEENVETVSKQISAMGYQENSLVVLIETIRLNVLMITFAMSSVAIVALLVAAIGITNTMIMSVLERTHEIGIMKALGARDRHIRLIFVVEGLILGLFGSGLGMLLGWSASFPGDLIAKSIMEKQAPGPVLLKETLFVYPAWLVSGVPIVVCLITTLAALYPAHRAARLDPVTSLRHE
jgi:putative ABC transport system permease protein